MQLVYSLKMGGSEKVALDISSHLDRSCFEPSVCALDFDGELAEELAREGIPHFVFHRKGLEPAILKRLYARIRRTGVDVVHTHHFPQLFYAALPARLAGARIVHTEHEFFSYTKSPLPRRLIRSLVRLTEGMTVVGPEVANYFVNTLGIPERSIRVVPNGVDVPSLEYDSALARRELGVDAEEFVVGTVGRLEPEKNQVALLDAVARLRSNGLAVRLLVGGDGSMRSELEGHANRMGIADRTTLLGYRRDIGRLLAAMDVFVLPSVREGLPIALIEAMAARRPAVGTNIGSVISLIRNGENGLIVPADDRTALTSAIERLFRSDELRTRLADAGRRTVEASFSLSTVIRTYQDIYRSAAGTTYVRN